MANTKTTKKSSKSSTASESAPVRRSRPSSAAKKRKTGIDSRTAKEIKCIVFAFLCFMLAMSYYTPFFGIVGNFIKNMGMFLFGNTAYVIPVFALAAGVHILIKNTLHPHVHRYVAVILLCVCVSGLLAVHSYRLNPTLFGGGYTQEALNAALEKNPNMVVYNYSGFWDKASNIILAAKTGNGGGILGYLAAILFIRLVSPVGTAILLWALILVFGIIATGTNLHFIPLGKQPARLAQLPV
ncbi:MAG: DNA translocase FtsK 4TM domain-containing protein, partial [Clostridia bacterium]